MSDWKRLGAVVTGAITLIAACWAGLVAVDGRYAHSADVRQWVNQTDRTLKEGQMQALQRERFEWAREAQRRPLTEMEQKRYLDVQEAIKRLQRELIPR